MLLDSPTIARPSRWALVRFLLARAARRLWSDILEELGLALALKRWLTTAPRGVPPVTANIGSIATSGVIAWHEFGRRFVHLGGLGDWGPGRLGGWRWMNGGLQHVVRAVDGLADVDWFETCVVEDWRGDIQDVTGLSASKSPLEKFASIDTFAEKQAGWCITPATPERLAQILEHRELRILQEPGDQGTDHFEVFSWCEHVFLCNAGGSHHFAAARWLSRRLGAPVPLRGRLYYHQLRVAAIERFLEHHGCFAVPADAASWSAMHAALAGYRVEHFETYLPAPFSTDYQVVIFPYSCKRSRRAAEMFRAAAIFDVGAAMRSAARASASSKESWFEAHVERSAARGSATPWQGHGDP